MNRTAQLQVKVLFVIRIFLWITAIIPTIYWIYYSHKLYIDGIFDAYEYASYLRPILYPCLLITLSALCMSFILRAISDHIKRKNDPRF